MNKHPFIFSDAWRYRLRRHLAFWIFWWLFLGFLYAFTPAPLTITYAQRIPLSMVESLLFITVHIFLSYSLMYFVVPRFLLKNKYVLTVIWVLLLFFATAGLSTVVARYLVEPISIYLFDTLRGGQRRPLSHSFFLGLLAGLRGGITIGGLAVAIKLMKHWYIKEQRNLQLQKENAESQLQLLKAQIHPAVEGEEERGVSAPVLDAISVGVCRHLITRRSVAGSVQDRAAGARAAWAA